MRSWVTCGSNFLPWPSPCHKAKGLLAKSLHENSYLTKGQEYRADHKFNSQKSHERRTEQTPLSRPLTSLLLGSNLGQMAEVPMWHTTGDLASRFFQHPSVPTSYRAWAQPALYPELSSPRAGLPIIQTFWFSPPHLSLHLSLFSLCIHAFSLFLPLCLALHGNCTDPLPLWLVKSYSPVNLPFYLNLVCIRSFRWRR